MGDAGEGLIDSESRIQERMDELARARAERSQVHAAPQETVQAAESLKLARADLQRQFDATPNERRRASIAQAIADLDRRLAAFGPAGGSR
jgi:hypothetical protein